MKLEEATTPELFAQALESNDEEFLLELEDELAYPVDRAKSFAVDEFWAPEELPAEWSQTVGELVTEGWDIGPMVRAAFDVNQAMAEAIYAVLTGARGGTGVDFSFPDTEGAVRLIPQVHPEVPFKTDVVAPVAFLGEEFLTKRFTEAGVRNLKKRKKRGGGFTFTGTIAITPEDQLEEAAYIKLDVPLVRESLVDRMRQRVNERVQNDPEFAISELMRILDEQAPDLAEKVRKQRLPSDVLQAYAVALFSDPTRGIQVLREAMGEFGYVGSRATTVIELGRDELLELGLHRDSKFLARAPLRVQELPEQELAYEGTLQRHCVGRFDMPYRGRVNAGTHSIWSLRSQHGIPLLTMEIDRRAWDRATTPEQRGSAVMQMKLKMNEHPPRTPEEDLVLRHMMYRLGIEPRSVGDYLKKPRQAQNPVRGAHVRRPEVRRTTVRGRRAARAAE